MPPEPFRVILGAWHNQDWKGLRTLEIMRRSIRKTLTPIGGSGDRNLGRGLSSSMEVIVSVAVNPIGGFFRLTTSKIMGLYSEGKLAAASAEWPFMCGWNPLDSPKDCRSCASTVISQNNIGGNVPTSWEPPSPRGRMLRRLSSLSHPRAVVAQRGGTSSGVAFGVRADR